VTPTDQVASKLLEIINQIQAGVVAHAPEAANLALQAVSYDGWYSLIIGFSWLALSLILYYIAKRYVYYIKNCEKKNESDEIALGLLVCAIVIILIFAAIELFDFWNWVQAFNPKLYLAHEIIQKVLT
jgi:hypothetical protein